MENRRLLLAGKVLLVGLGVGAGVLGAEEFRVRGLSRTTPRTLSLAQLLDEGPGDDAWLVLEGALPCTWAFAHERRGSARHRTHVGWVPAVPVDGAFHRSLADLPAGAPRPTPEDVRMVFRIKRAEEEEDVAELFGRTSFEGLLLDRIAPPDEKTLALFRESYPGLDPGALHVFEPDRAPWSSTKLGLVLGVGTFSLLVGLGWLVRDLLARRAARDDEEGTSSPD